jgi:hypothetical protein
MYEFLKPLHSYFALVLLLVLVISIAVVFISKFSKKPFVASHLKTALIGLISSHIQLLLGLVLYFISPLGFSNLSGAVMKDSFGRLHAVEHPLTMIIAVVLITIGYSKAKKAFGTDKAYNAVLIYYSIGLILILSRLPWQVWMKG